jgi:hypothetical protein
MRFSSTEFAVKWIALANQVRIIKGRMGYITVLFTVRHHPSILSAVHLQPLSRYLLQFVCNPETRHKKGSSLQIVQLSGQAKASRT